jgi:hypothetical protein
VQVARAEVVSSEFQEELTHGTLFIRHGTVEEQNKGGIESVSRKRAKSVHEKGKGGLTSPGMGYETGTMARYPYLPSPSVLSLPRQSGAGRSVYWVS